MSKDSKKKVNNEYEIATIIVAALLGVAVMCFAYYLNNK